MANKDNGKNTSVITEDEKKNLKVKAEETAAKAKSKVKEATEKIKEVVVKEEEPIEIPSKRDDTLDLEELVNAPVAEHKTETPEETAPATPEAPAQDTDPFTLQAAIMQNMQAVSAKHTSAEAATTLNNNLMMGFTGVYRGQKHISEQIDAERECADNRHKELSAKIDAICGNLPTAAYIVALIILVAIVFACTTWLPKGVAARKLVSLMVGIVGGATVLALWPNKANTSDD